MGEQTGRSLLLCNIYHIAARHSVGLVYPKVYLHEILPLHDASFPNHGPIHCEFRPSGVGKWGGVPASPELSVALWQLYNSDFDQSRATLDSYSGRQPSDPLAYSLKAATYLFAELDQAGAMCNDVLG